MEKVFSVNLDIKRSTSAFIGAVQFDNNTSVLSITLKDNSKPFGVPNGYDVQLVFRRPDKKIFVIDGETIVDENGQTLKFILDSLVLSVFGMADAEVRMTKGEEVLTTGRFALEIRESLLASGQEVSYFAKVSAIPTEKIKSILMGVEDGK